MTASQLKEKSTDLERNLVTEVEQYLMKPEYRQEIQNVMAQRHQDATAYQVKLNGVFEKIASNILPQLQAEKEAEGFQVALTISVTEQQAKAGGLQPTISVVCTEG